MRTLMTLHRWLGACACLAVLIFAGSGLLHPVMSRSQPQPEHFTPPRIVLPEQSPPLRNVLRAQGIEYFGGAMLAALPGGPAYRIETTGEPARYFSASTGVEIPQGEREHARALARHFLGDTRTPIETLTRIDTFDAEYTAVNRLLPVWRVRFARPDGLTVYVDTAGNRLGTLVDNRKRALQTVFRGLHSFSWLESRPWLRLPLMLGLLAATASTAGIGLYMFAALKRADQRLQRLPARRWHRRLSLLIGVSALCFTLSGGWHLLQQQREIPPPDAPERQFSAEELGAFVPHGAFTLLRVHGRACYQIAAPSNPAMMMEHHHGQHADAKNAENTSACLDTRDGAAVPNAESTLAEQLARHYARTDAALESLEPISRFSNEYGFINKRLPVWKVRFKGDATSWYVETGSGTLALRAQPGAALEGWVFAYFHKARFIGDAYKNWRDAALMLFAAGNIIVAGLGLWLLCARYRRARPAAAIGAIESN